MSLESELQKVRREQELALQAAKEAEQRAKIQRQQLRQAALSQRQAMVARWAEIVTALLDETAQATWGKDSYTLIKPDGAQSLTWAVIRVQGKAKLNYQVTLQVSEADLDNLALSPNDELVRPSGFKVAGVEEFVSPLSEAGLKDALVSAFRSGPRSDGLDQYAESVLAQSPYKEGEYETQDWKLIVFPILSFLAGCGFLNSGDAGAVALL